MTTQPADLQPCVHKSCPWRGTDPHACPMHESDTAWDRHHLLLTEAFASKRQTRHRR